ncbi:Hsp70 family protein, partial [Mycobacterium bouchedurhonense]|uniref:Hsp70 family protein n=1 Tax=Mycobacterium bouchedurhonense TaxID=701041 RepID=UPI00360D577A
TEKSVAEYGDKVSAADKGAIETAIASLRTALEGDDAEGIKAKTNDLMQASMKRGEAMYAASQAEGAPGADGAAASAEKKDDVIDADFQQSYGIPIGEAGVQQLTEMTQILSGTAGAA